MKPASSAQQTDENWDACFQNSIHMIHAIHLPSSTLTSSLKIWHSKDPILRWEHRRFTNLIEQLSMALVAKPLKVLQSTRIVLHVVRWLHAKPYWKECVWDYSLMTRVLGTFFIVLSVLSYCKYILLGPCNLIVYSRHSNMTYSREIQLLACSSLQNGRSFSLQCCG